MLACAGLAQPNMGQVQTPTFHPSQCLWQSCLECSRCAPKVTKPGHLRAAAWLILYQFAPQKSAHNMCSSVPVGKCCRSSPGVLQE